jgi:hypothetical protein
VDELDVYNMDRLQVESEALDLRVSSSLLLPKRGPPAGPQPVRVLLEARQPRPDSLIIPTARGVEVLLVLMMNPMQSLLNSLVRVEAGAQLPPFCLVTQDLPPMSLEGVRVVAGSAISSSTERPSPCRFPRDGYKKGGYVLEERVNHDIALSSERDEADRKKRHAADTTHFLFDSIYSLD